MKLCVLVPAYNCAAVLPEVCGRVSLTGPEDEIIVVDDCSEDDTYAVASRLPRVAVFRNQANLGYGGTSNRLYQLALERGADFSVNLHGDMGHRPEDAAIIVRALMAREHDVVLGSRLLFILEGARRQGWSHLFSNDVASGMSPERVAGHLALTWLQNRCYGTRLHSFHEGMRGCSRAVMSWAVESDLPAWYDYDAELLLHAIRSGLRIGEVPIAPSYDARSKSAAPRVRYGLRVATHAIRTRLKEGPLRPGPVSAIAAAATRK
jgi:glycosyltransferase involved in cell wall biosynthesis